MKTSGTFLTVLLFAPLAALHAADLTIAGIFTDHTVLQRDVAAPVWGWANPNEQVTLAFAGQRKSATADSTGKWFVRLDPMSASAEGRELKGFTIAGEDGKFVPASAVILGPAVAVSSERITKPAAVRYGWAQVPDVNLTNREGLPAAPFRSDMPANLNPAEKSE